MQTELEHLIQMANQIVANNSFHDDIEQTAATTAGHLQKFWARSMKKQIIDYAAQDGSDLSPAAKLAVQQLAS